MVAVNTTLPPSRRSSKRALAVRMMVAETAWLDGELRWEDGRVAWANQGRLVVPGTGDLALAQRRLYKIRRYPISADLALGDSAAWAARRRDRLALAKRLRAIAAPDLAALAFQARMRDASAIRSLVELLLAEALCINGLPVSPAAALLACGAHAHAQLIGLIADDSAPLSARALAALTLGAIQMRNEELRIEKRTGSIPHSQFSTLNAQFPWIRRAYAYGQRYGLTTSPAITALLLEDADGAALAQRCERALRSGGAFALAPELLRELLARGSSPARIVALAEAAAGAERLAARILRHRDELPDRPARRRRAVAAELLRQRRQILANVAELLRSYVRRAGDPQAIYLFVSFVELMLDFAPHNGALADAALLPLRHVLDLPDDLQRPALELLVELSDRLWDLAATPTGKDGQANPTSGWLQARWARHIQPLLLLLQATGDPAITREAAVLGLQYRLCRVGWREPELYRLALALIRDLGLENEDEADRLCLYLGVFAHAGEARAAFLPLSKALAAVDKGLRAHFLSVIFDAVPHTHPELAALLRRLARFLRQLIHFDKDEVSSCCLCQPLASCAVALYTDRPAQADVWLDWLLGDLSTADRNRSVDEAFAIEVGLTMALALCDGDFVRFQSVVAAARQHSFNRERDSLRPGIEMLQRFPALRDTLAQLFPQQPHRCMNLVVRLGAATRLGADALAPLGELKPEPGMGDRESGYDDWFLVLGSRFSLAEDWRDLLELAPDLAPTAAAYQYAQWLLGGSQSLPAGVRRALEQPRKLAGELTYLERALADHPDRADLHARAANLRARLADRERLLSDARAEACERLLQANAEVQLKAAEAQVLACFRARLADIAGPLPAGLRLDDDLLNAILLATDITQNRRLLLRLLRAHLAGVADWRERHPANRAFLEKLAAAGVDTGAWLGEYPRVYRCSGVAGGRVRLHLERNPLRILQMGNYMSTCLSVGGINAFSTVANACELNKRVVYATDGAGHVVGRKLIAIGAEGTLLGFYTYTTLDGPGTDILRAIFRHCLRGFAARCGLALADDGMTPTLFAEAWYDDGCEAWGEAVRDSVPTLGSNRHVNDRTSKLSGATHC